MPKWIVQLRGLEPVIVEGMPDRKDGKLLFEDGSFIRGMFEEKNVVAFYPVPAPEARQD